MILETIKQFFANALKKSNYGTDLDRYTEIINWCDKPDGMTSLRASLRSDIG